MTRQPRPPLVEPVLDRRLVQFDSRRAAVDHRADRRPVALAPGREAQQTAEAVNAHPLSSIRAPISRIAAAKPGKLVAIISALSTLTGSRAPNPSTRNAIAIR